MIRTNANVLTNLLWIEVSDIIYKSMFYNWRRWHGLSQDDKQFILSNEDKRNWEYLFGFKCACEGGKRCHK